MSYTIIYIAGPMTGLPDCNYPAFFEAEGKLSKRFPDAEIINPARNFGKAKGLTHADYMRRCMPQIMLATHIYALTGWEQSIGARWEVETAKMLGLPVQVEQRIYDSIADQVIQCVADFYGIQALLVTSPTREQPYTEARQVCMYWLYEVAGLTLVATANAVGRKEHGNVMYACRRIKDMIAMDAQFQSRWVTLEPMLEGVVSRKEEVA